MIRGPKTRPRPAVAVFISEKQRFFILTRFSRPVRTIRPWWTWTGAGCWVLEERDRFVADAIKQRFWYTEYALLEEITYGIHAVPKQSDHRSVDSKLSLPLSAVQQHTSLLNHQTHSTPPHHPHPPHTPSQEQPATPHKHPTGPP